MKLLHYILDLIYPPKCLLCDGVLAANQLDLCPNCRIVQPICPISKNKLPFVDSWLALWYYEENARESLLRYKFRGKRCYAKGYGRLLAMKIQQELDGKYDLITWIPISKQRSFQRGYDQVQLLADAVGRELDCAPAPCLNKTRDNPPQSGISGHAQRRANVLGAYQILDREKVANKRVLLLDDIITTGSTAEESAKVLLTAGASEVHVAAVAAAKHHERK